MIIICQNFVKTHLFVLHTLYHTYVRTCMYACIFVGTAQTHLDVDWSRYLRERDMTEDLGEAASMRTCVRSQTAQNGWNSLFWVLVIIQLMPSLCNCATTFHGMRRSCMSLRTTSLAIALHSKDFPRQTEKKKYVVPWYLEEKLFFFFWAVYIYPSIQFDNRLMLNFF